MSWLATSALQSSAPPSPAFSKNAGAEQLQEHFLKLFIKQLQSQDPMNPLDSAQTTAQLAQISTVSHLDKLNTTLGGVAQLIRQQQTLQAAHFIGREVLLEGKTLTLHANDAAHAEVTVPSGVHQLELSIYDQQGYKVKQLVLPASPGQQAIYWDGTNEQGERLADGNYQLVASAQQADGTRLSLNTRVYSRIISASFDASGATLQLANHREIPLESVEKMM